MVLGENGHTTLPGIVAPIFSLIYVSHERLVDMAKFRKGEMVKCIWNDDMEQYLNSGELYIIDDISSFKNYLDWIDKEWVYLRGVVGGHGKQIPFRAIRFAPVRRRRQ